MKVAALIQNTSCLVDVFSEEAVSGQISITSSFMMGLSLLNVDAETDICCAMGSCNTGSGDVMLTHRQRGVYYIGMCKIHLLIDRDHGLLLLSLLF